MSLSSYAKLYDVLMKSKLPTSRKLAFTALVDLHALGVANPKMDALARRTGLCRRTVERALRQLQELGLIQVAYGQRQSSYRIAARKDWPKILLRQNVVTEANPVTTKCRNVLRQNVVTGASVSLLLTDSSSQTSNLEKERSREKARKLSTRARPPEPKAPPSPPPVEEVVEGEQRPPDFSEAPALLSEVREIYRRAGVPVAPKHEQLALQLLLSLDPETRARAPRRLPNFLKWALTTGRWDSPATTKSLVNVLRDGDWDVDLTVRDLPSPPRKGPSTLERQEQEYLRRHAQGGL